MKRLLVFFIVSAALPYALFASDSLPFAVSLGGQAAKDGTPFAKIENPVAADAELAVESKSDMISVNVNRVNAKNEPVPGSTPAVILLQGKTKTNIDKTMDGKKLSTLISCIKGWKRTQAGCAGRCAVARDNSAFPLARATAKGRGADGGGSCRCWRGEGDGKGAT